MPSKTEAKHPKVWGTVGRGPPRTKSSLHVPAEGKSLAPARVTNAGGIAPVQSLPRVSISSVGAAGPPGTSLTLKPSLAHMSRQPVTTTSCCSRLERERGRESQRQRGWGWLTYLLQPKVGMGLFLTQSGMYLLFQPRGSEGLPPRRLSQQHWRLCEAMVSTENPELQREEAKSHSFFTRIDLMGRERWRRQGSDGRGSLLPWKGGEQARELLAASAASHGEQGGVSHASRAFQLQ